MNTGPATNSHSDPENGSVPSGFLGNLGGVSPRLPDDGHSVFITR